MKSPFIVIDGRQIIDWSTFHDVFAVTMGFPSYYGRNMDAWIDCMSSLDDPEAGMTTIHAPEGNVLVLQINYAYELRSRCPAIYAALVECAAFVNWRRIESGEEPILALSFDMSVSNAEKASS